MNNRWEGCLNTPASLARNQNHSGGHRKPWSECVSHTSPIPSWTFSWCCTPTWHSSFQQPTTQTPYRLFTSLRMLFWGIQPKMQDKAQEAVFALRPRINPAFPQLRWLLNSLKFRLPRSPHKDSVWNNLSSCSASITKNCSPLHRVFWKSTTQSQVWGLGRNSASSALVQMRPWPKLLTTQSPHVSPPSSPTKVKTSRDLIWYLSTLENLKYHFSSFLLFSPEPGISWKKDCRFPDTWEVQQKVNLVAQKAVQKPLKHPSWELSTLSSVLALWASGWTPTALQSRHGEQSAMREANGADWENYSSTMLSFLPLHKLQEHLV